MEKDSGYRSVPLQSKQYHSESFLVSTLRKKFEKAKVGLKDTSEAYHELSAALDKDLVKIWEKEERKAQAERGEALRIYDVRLEQGTESYCKVLIYMLDLRPLLLQHHRRLTSDWG